MMELIKLENAQIYKELDEDGQMLVRPTIKRIADIVIKTIKDDDSDPSIASLTWQETKPYRSLALRQKEDLVEMIEARIVD